MTESDQLDKIIESAKEVGVSKERLRIITAINNNRITKKQREGMSHDYASAYTDAINHIISIINNRQ